MILADWLQQQILRWHAQELYLIAQKMTENRFSLVKNMRCTKGRIVSFIPTADIQFHL